MPLNKYAAFGPLAQPAPARGVGSALAENRAATEGVKAQLEGIHQNLQLVVGHAARAVLQVTASTDRVAASIDRATAAIDRANPNAALTSIEAALGPLGPMASHLARLEEISGSLSHAAVAVPQAVAEVRVLLEKIAGELLCQVERIGQALEASDPTDSLAEIAKSASNLSTVAESAYCACKQLTAIAEVIAKYGDDKYSSAAKPKLPR